MSVLQTSDFCVQSQPRPYGLGYPITLLRSFPFPTPQLPALRNGPLYNYGKSVASRPGLAYDAPLGLKNGKGVRH